MRRRDPPSSTEGRRTTTTGSRGDEIRSCRFTLGHPFAYVRSSRKRLRLHGVRGFCALKQRRWRKVAVGRGLPRWVSGWRGLPRRSHGPARWFGWGRDPGEAVIGIEVGGQHKFRSLAVRGGRWEALP